MWTSNFREIQAGERFGWHDFFTLCFSLRKSCSSGWVTGQCGRPANTCRCLQDFARRSARNGPLIEAPGHLVTADEVDDATSIIAISLLFFWNCNVMSGSGRDAVFLSHHEFGRFASRDPSVSESVRKQFEKYVGVLAAHRT